MARLISLEDIRRQYTLSVAREVGGREREREGDGEGVARAVENKLGGFKNFTASASAWLFHRSLSLSRARAFSASFFLPGTWSLSFFFILPLSLSLYFHHNVFVAASFIS